MRPANIYISTGTDSVYGSENLVHTKLQQKSIYGFWNQASHGSVIRQTHRQALWSLDAFYKMLVIFLFD